MAVAPPPNQPGAAQTLSVATAPSDASEPPSVGCRPPRLSRRRPRCRQHLPYRLDDVSVFDVGALSIDDHDVDRIIVATARVLGARLVTSDEGIIDADLVGTV